MTSLAVLPCVSEGPELVGWDSEGTHYQHRRRWISCRHPKQPLGPNVCAVMGCGPTCKGYEADQSKTAAVRGIAPLWSKKLALPHPGAFNAGLIRVWGRLLVAYRTPAPESRIWVAELSEDYQPLNTWRIYLDHPRCSYSQEDPRLFWHDGTLHLSFVGVDPYPEHAHGIRANILYARLDGCMRVQAIYYPEYEKRSVWEKNWTFFSANNKLYAIYNIKPHVVLEIDGNNVVGEYTTPTPHAWTGGHLRGGASPYFDHVENVFYHFFHGRIGSYNDTTYNTGVYTFEAKPPFTIDRMTRDPIQWADPEVKIGNQTGAAVVFVCGAVLEPHNRQWLLSMGVQDREVQLAAWDSTTIENALQEPARPADLPPVYVIYCEEIPERKARIEQHLAERGVKPIWWRSIHGKSWGLATTKVYVEGESPINAGQAGLVLGHYTLWQHLEAIGCPEAIILEDDALLCEGFGERFDETVRHLPENTDLVYIGHLGCKDRIAEKLSGGVVRLNFVPWGTHAYYLRKSAYPTLLARMAEMRNPVDSQLWFNVLKDNHLHWYAVEDSLADQESAAGLVPTTLHGFDTWQIHPEPLRTQLTQTHQEIQHGWATLEKCRMLAGLIVREKPKVVVEIGVYGGKSLLPMALALRYNNDGGVIYGIDPWTKEPCLEGFDPEDANYKWWAACPLGVIMGTLCDYLTAHHLWPWVRLLAAPSYRVADVFNDKPIDVLHIDGTHSEEASCRDVRAYLPRVRTGGWIWFDDTCWATTQRALRELDCACRMIVDDPACGGGLRLYRKL